MRTAIVQSLRVEPQLRDAAKRVLLEGEMSSAFIESAVRDAAERCMRCGTDCQHRLGRQPVARRCKRPDAAQP